MTYVEVSIHNSIVTISPKSLSYVMRIKCSNDETKISRGQHRLFDAKNKKVRKSKLELDKCLDRHLSKFDRQKVEIQILLTVFLQGK